MVIRSVLPGTVKSGSGQPPRARVTQVRGSWPFGDEDAPAWPGYDQSFIHEDLDSAAGCGPRDPVGLGQPVQAWHLLARQKLAIGDLLAQFRRDAQIGRYQLSDHKINVPTSPLTCVCTRLCCVRLGAIGQADLRTDKPPVRRSNHDDTRH